MLDQQHGHALRRDIAHDLKYFLNHQRRQAHRGLVHQQHLGPAHQGAPHGEHLLLAPAERASELLGALLQARENAKHLVNIVFDGGGVFADISPHLQVLQNAHAGEHAATLGHHGQALFDQVPGALATDALAPVFDIAGVDGQDASDGLHGGGFARAVGADQGHQLAFAHLKIDAFDSLDAAVGNLQTGDLEKNICHA